MSRIVNITLAGPGSFALTRVIQQALFDAGYSVNAGDTAMDVVIPTRGCDAIKIAKVHTFHELAALVLESDKRFSTDMVEMAESLISRSLLSRSLTDPDSMRLCFIVRRRENSAEAQDIARRIVNSIDATCEARTVTMQGEAVLPFELPRTQLEVDAVALAGMVVGHSANAKSGLGYRLARRILAETTGFEEPKTNG